MIKSCRNIVKMSDAPKEAPVGRRMKYPYTYTAQIAQFPYKHYWKHSWLARYWVYGIIASFPLFYKIHKAGKLFYHLKCKLCPNI